MAGWPVPRAGGGKPCNVLARIGRRLCGRRSRGQLPWSNGPVKGRINRSEMLKRQMFGRAHLDLLGRRFVRALVWAGPGHPPSVRPTPAHAESTRPHSPCAPPAEVQPSPRPLRPLAAAAGRARELCCLGRRHASVTDGRFPRRDLPTGCASAGQDRSLPTHRRRPSPHSVPTRLRLQPTLTARSTQLIATASKQLFLSPHLFAASSIFTLLTRPQHPLRPCPGATAPSVRGN